MSTSHSDFPCQYHPVTAPYSVMYHLEVSQWARQQPEFHRIDSHHRNNNQYKQYKVGSIVLQYVIAWS